VHGLGVEADDVGELGCDVLIAGTHKWMFGPRGTGIVWTREAVHGEFAPLVASFSRHGGWGGEMTPGGDHAFEHRWALPEAFALHRGLGKLAVTQRIHALNRELKQALAELRHVTVVTPQDEELSAGVICFDVRGSSPHDVVRGLRAHDIVASVTPYTPAFPRLSPGLLNSFEEIDPVIAAVRALR